MVEIPLVTEQIEDGNKLVERLVAGGYPVTAAAWLWPTEHGQWFLYLVSPLVESEGRKGAYRRIITILREMSPCAIEPLDVKLLSPTDPISKALLDVRRAYPARSRLPLRVSQFGGVSAEGAYIYPSILTSERRQSQHREQES